MPQAIQQLHSGALDVIADVHGELSALIELLKHLGYDQFGRHPEGRHLVFLGDLVDRGPDSPGVVEKISGLYFAKRAQCILGNHELRLLNQINKPDNSWINEIMAQKARRKGWQAPMRVAHHLQLRAALTFFYQLPIALERSDLRLIHACWHSKSIETLPNIVGSWSTLFARYRRNNSSDLKALGWTRKKVSQLKSKYPLSIGPPDVEHIPYLPELSEYFSLEQNLNPLRVLTQGLYGPLQSKQPFWSGYRWQMSDRVRWWNEYQEDVPVVFGHYWRPRYQKLEHNQKPSLFEGIEASEFLGTRQNCFCLDFAVGLRFQERLANADNFQGSLAALRIPEEGSLADWELVFDDGESVVLPSPQKQDS